MTWTFCEISGGAQRRSQDKKNRAVQSLPWEVLGQTLGTERGTKEKVQLQTITKGAEGRKVLVVGLPDCVWDHPLPALPREPKAAPPCQA
jgi:hypothetical protein